MRSSSRAFAAIVAACGLFAAVSAAAPPRLRELSRNYRASNAPADRRLLASYADSLQGGERALARLALGVAEFDGGRYAEAAEVLAGASGIDPLSDYVVYYRARALARAERFGEVEPLLAGFARAHPASPFLRDANRLRAESLIRAGRLSDAAALLSDRQAAFSEPARLYLLGRTRELSGASPEAIDAYRRVYYHYPFSEDAKAAEERLDALRRSLGAAYPEAPAALRLARADALYNGGAYPGAAEEYGRAIPGLRGPERDRAIVRKAAADYRRVRTSAAHAALVDLRVADPDLDAERLYLLGECARRRGAAAEFERRAAELAQRYPASPWREELLLSLGNHYLLENDAARYRRYYEEAARAFPQGKHAAATHWKVCWRAHLDRDPRARALFEEHVRLYPQSDQAAGALYWLGRHLEAEGRAEAARGLYESILERFPHYYYEMLARERLAATAAPSRLEAVWQAVVTALPGPRRLDPRPRPETVRLLERGRLLFAAGLDELAEKELTSGDYRLSDGYLIGLELGRQAIARDDHFRALRHMKRYGFGYLRMPIDAAPREFWEQLYPLPFEDGLRRHVGRHGLDPYLVAGLIRQESEFNPKAVSRAGAMGLMQVMPAVGAELARKLGVDGFTKARLHDPEISLRFGTYHLQEALRQYGGNLEYTLAAYNAGGSRVRTWASWGEFREPGEFVETIPFTETRGYVQSVLRNREMYRKLYGGDYASSTTPSRESLRTAGAGN